MLAPAVERLVALKGGKYYLSVRQDRVRMAREEPVFPHEAGGRKLFLPSDKIPGEIDITQACNVPEEFLTRLERHDSNLLPLIAAEINAVRAQIGYLEAAQVWTKNLADPFAVNHQRLGFLQNHRTDEIDDFCPDGVGLVAQEVELETEILAFNATLGKGYRGNIADGVPGRWPVLERLFNLDEIKTTAALAEALRGFFFEERKVFFSTVAELLER